MIIKLGDKQVTIRKWKGRDRKTFVDALNAGELDSTRIMNSLVYDCIEEKDVILSVDEFKYVLTRIRAHSIGEEVDIEFRCDCGCEYTQKFNLLEAIKFTGGELKDIKVGNTRIHLGSIRNREMYERLIAEDPVYDLILRIHEFEDAYTVEDIIEKFDDMDVDQLDAIMDVYESGRFKVDDVVKVQCPECNREELYSLDEIPNFFPAHWFE